MSQILIVDAGSTNIDWCLIGHSKQYFKSNGWNPTQDHCKLEIPSALISEIKQLDRIHYYGSGVSDKNAIRSVREAFSFLNHNQLEVCSDLLGASRALFGEGEGLAIILGTGSNVAFYSNDNLEFATPSLGYLISDEGSGNHIGKLIIKDYMYGKMPKDIKNLFDEMHPLSKSDILSALYKEPKPNRFLASFCIFLNSISHEWKDDLLLQAFDDLLKYKILPHKNFLSIPIGFVGSIAFNFKEQLERACGNYDIENIKILKNPVEKLSDYHLEKLQ